MNSEWYIGGKVPNNKKQKPNNIKITMTKLVLDICGFITKYQRLTTSDWVSLEWANIKYDKE